MKQKKFGARVLTREELILTLPTYDKLLDQIEEIRGQSWNSEETSNLLNQKINNISILGARGSGKTSILKTLIRDLEKQNEENTSDDINIILPMMIPESMSDDKNLMSMILGLFKGVVDRMDEMETEQHRRNPKCWEVHESDVQKQYNHLMKIFCLIQPEFKKVSIEQYTTENDYVRKHSEVYQAEIDFLTSLNGLINLIVQNGKKKDSVTSDKKLIFVFIDDIDLSTHRCVDVVRTLLAYLSHPRIVTVLSGDLQTFEEALTIDFLRKEHALSGDIANIHFVDADSGAFLERKKELSYEYIKKVLPAPYRHHVKVWDLNSRGDYKIDVERNHRHDDEDKVVKSVSLSELLTDCFIDIQNPPIFQYLDRNKSIMNNIPQVFHVFDSTSRGLNNVYNILLDTYDITRSKEKLKNYESILFQQYKLLLENIVSSNSTLNRYRKELFDGVVRFGTNFESTRVNLVNFSALILSSLTIKDDNSASIPIEDDNQSKNDKKSVEKSFILFVFIDFAIRILKQTHTLREEKYLELKFRFVRIFAEIFCVVRHLLKEHIPWIKKITFCQE